VARSNTTTTNHSAKAASADELERLGDVLIEQLGATRATGDRVGAAVAAAALAARHAADEAHQRDRTIRIARAEGAWLRMLGEATGLSPQTISNICNTHC
jgi:hypothetical protein